MWGGDRSQAAGASSEETAAVDKTSSQSVWVRRANSRQTAGVGGRLRMGTERQVLSWSWRK